MSGMAVTRPVTSPSSEERFDAFVAARGGALWRSAWLLTGDRHLAEDLVQTALAKAWPKWSGIGEEGRFEAYVRRTLFTTYVAWWRRKWNGERPTAQPPDSAGDAADPDLGHDLIAALAGLPRMQRAVVVCRWFEDLSEAQTAERLGISVGTVKSHGSRALAALRSSPHLTEESP
ncbi:MAG TPA: SigE family RNA polymerase sigma factor [Nocardioides sp.]|nr:SigE family RNA polymerase sigma factor [Nocardioides sp.]